jgi:signal peptidase II
MSGYSRRSLSAAWFYLLAGVVFAIDQVSKYIVSIHLPLGISTPVIGEVMYLTREHNEGGAFGLFRSGHGLLVMVSIIAVIAIVLLLFRNMAQSRLVKVAFALQLGGALGNLTDRLRLHYVIDFIDFRVWPIFNVADTAITVGIVLLAYYLVVCDGRKPDKAVSQEVAGD